MRKVQELKSKSGKNISFLIEEMSSTPNLTLIESPGGLVETKEKTAESSRNVVDICKKNNFNYITADFSNNNSRSDQPVSRLRFGNRVKDLESIIDFVNAKYKSPIILIGSSMGGFITFNTANYSEKVKGIVLNCAAVKAHICVKSSMSPEDFDSWKEKNVAVVWGVPFAFDFYEDLVNLDAIKIIPRINKPIIWFHGTDDMVVPISQAFEAKKLNHKINLIKVQGGGHRFGDKMKPGQWEQMGEDFIGHIMTKQTLYILCGLPFAGKTTLVEELVKRFGWTGVDLDEINTNRRLGIHGNDVISVKDWKITYRMSYDMVDQALKAGKTVINDSTNFTREQRDKLREIANKYSVPSKVIYVNIPEKTARERWKQNRNTKARYDVKDEDFAEVTNNFQIPTADENVIYYDQTSPIDEWIKKNITEAV